MLEHEQGVPEADAQPSAAPALPDDDVDDGGAEPGDDLEVVGDGLGLAPFLGADPGIGPRRVDEGDDRETVLFGHLHDAQGLAVALGVGLAEVPFDAGPGGPTLLVANERDGPAFVEGQAGHDGRIVPEPPVAMHLHEIREQVREIVQRIRPLGVAGELDDVDGRQLRGDLRPLLLDLEAESGDPLLLRRVVALLESVDLLLELDDGLFQAVKVGVALHFGSIL